MIICYCLFTLMSFHTMKLNSYEGLLHAKTDKKHNKITVKEVHMNHVLHSKPQSHTKAWKFSLSSQLRHHTRFDIKKAKHHWVLCLVS